MPPTVSRRSEQRAVSSGSSHARPPGKAAPYFSGGGVMRLIEPLRGRGAAFELVTPIPYTALQHMLDETGPWGIRAYDKGINLDEPFSRCAPTPFA